MIQNMDKYTAEDLKVWQALFSRQYKNLQEKGSETYMLSLNKMSPVLNADCLPNFERINEWFSHETAWQIEVVPGLIPVEDFFGLLAQKKFCSSTWLRSREQLDYLEEPDMFHDIFGHVPLLCDPVFSEFMHAFGQLGLSVIDQPQRVLELQRLYWYTIEFGLIKEDDIKVYGAGLMSSFGETNRSLGKEVQHLPFEIETVLNEPFRNDVMQEAYFVLNSFDDLFESIETMKNLLTA